ncbi:hypothetical protein ACGFI9_21825 [Micromonospora sp. NPDC048930]|uniref:hypothetical protein n=1 Tax=Micromonospora sp. NPDC048930 TaxID=3364261 RepID=UPI003710DF05
MYNVITYGCPVLYLALMVAGAIVAGRLNGGPAARERRWRQAMAMWTVALTLGLACAVAHVCAGSRVSAVIWVLSVATAGALMARYRPRQAADRERRIRVGPPTSLQDYLTRFDLNVAVTWAKNPLATVHVPCPWCAAADFAVFDVPPGSSGARDMIAALSAHHTCLECRRGGRYLITHADPEHRRYHYQVIQTLGDEPPAWLAAGYDHAVRR